MKQGIVGSLAVSRLGYGCYAMGGAYGARDPSVWGPLLRGAVDLGVTYFDVAESYGHAEEILGRELSSLRERLVWSTKVGPDSRGNCDLSRQRVIRACEASLRRMQTTWIDLYLVHFDDPRTPVEETVEALDLLKASGKIREYGVGHLPLERVEEYARAGRPAAVLCELSPLARSAVRGLLPFARSRKMAAVAFSPTGRGLLGETIRPGHVFPDGDIRRLDPLFSPDSIDSALRIRGHLAALGCPLGKTAVQVGIAWVLAQQGVEAVLTGPSSLAHLAENAAAADLELPPAALESIDRFLAEEDGRRQSLALNSCRAILAGPLDEDGDTAYRQLIQAAEAAVQHGWARERDLVPLVLRVVGLRKTHHGRYHPELDVIRRDLAAAVTLPGGPPGSGAGQS